jgi:hypothetical protein
LEQLYKLSGAVIIAWSLEAAHVLYTATMFAETHGLIIASV